MNGMTQNIPNLKTLSAVNLQPETFLHSYRIKFIHLSTCSISKTTELFIMFSGSKNSRSALSGGFGFSLKHSAMYNVRNKIKQEEE